MPKDEQAVRTLAQLAKANVPPKFLVELERDLPDLLDRCRKNLRAGNTVVICGFQDPIKPPPGGGLTAEYLKDLEYDVDAQLHLVHGE